jgi:gamma-glutamylcyclotransferase (GGCT)/AIG2-like uncharacterized protein YtfP
MTRVHVVRARSTKNVMGNNEALFAYGTLKDTVIQQEIFGRILKGVQDMLQGYEISDIVIHKNSYPIIVPNSVSYVEGLLFSVAAEELKKADEFETDAYTRRKVTLKSGISAWAYMRP